MRALPWKQTYRPYADDEQRSYVAHVARLASGDEVVVAYAHDWAWTADGFAVLCKTERVRETHYFAVLYLVGRPIDSNALILGPTIGGKPEFHSPMRTSFSYSELEKAIQEAEAALPAALLLASTDKP